MFPTRTKSPRFKRKSNEARTRQRGRLSSPSSRVHIFQRTLASSYVRQEVCARWYDIPFCCGPSRHATRPTRIAFAPGREGFFASSVMDIAVMLADIESPSFDCEKLDGSPSGISAAGLISFPRCHAPHPYHRCISKAASCLRPTTLLRRRRSGQNPPEPIPLQSELILLA